jgi:hypothetical protein
MQIRFVLLTLLALLFAEVATTQQPPAGRDKDKTKKVDSPMQKNDRLRQPGFLFLELDCYDLASHIEFFKTTCGFELNRKDGNFVILRSERGEILLNGVKAPPKDKQAPRIGGLRVEIGIVVADIDKSFAEAKKHPTWKIAAGVQRQSWGVRDYRVYSPEGYYIRITEGPK